MILRKISVNNFKNIKAILHDYVCLRRRKSNKSLKKLKILDQNFSQVGNTDCREQLGVFLGSFNR